VLLTKREGNGLQFEGHTLEGLGGRLHDFLAGEGAASERDLGWAGMGGQHGAEVVAAGQSLYDARGEELLSQLHDLQVAVRCEWRRLDDNGVAGKNRGADLATSKVDGEVPWHNANDKAKRGVSLDGLLGVVLLNDLLLKLKLAEGTQPGATSSNLSLGELVLP
jgi:hypothetical protein